MSNIVIEPRTVLSGRFQTMRSEAQLLYFFIAVTANEDLKSDAYIACNMCGADFIEVQILEQNSFIAVDSEDHSLVKVNGIRLADGRN